MLTCDIESNYLQSAHPQFTMFNPLSSALSVARNFIATPQKGYKPHFSKFNEKKFLQEIGNFFDMDEIAVQHLWSDYKKLSTEKGYAKQLGEFKTLCMDEAFVMYVLFNIYIPKSIVEIGVQFGRSTRRIIDMKNRLGMNAEITSYDLEDKVQFFEKDTEATLILKDLTHGFKEEILDKRQAGNFLYLDAHPYHILDTVIQGCMQSQNWILTIHDCTAGICNPHMTISKNKQDISSHDGLWERYVLAKAFNIKNPLDPALDTAETATHRLRIFSTCHGLALIMPKDMNAFKVR